MAFLGDFQRGVIGGIVGAFVGESHGDEGVIGGFAAGLTLGLTSVAQQRAAQESQLRDVRAVNEAFARASRGGVVVPVPPATNFSARTSSGTSPVAFAPFASTIHSLGGGNPAWRFSAASTRLSLAGSRR